MFKTTIRGLLAHKLRLATTALAITLGVAFVAGTLVLTSTMSKTFDDLFASVYSGTSTVVRSSTVVKGAQGPDLRPSISEQILPLVRSAPGVREAIGGIQGYAQFVDHNGKAIGNPQRGAPTLGTAYQGDSPLEPFQIVAGRAPRGGEEVVVDKETSDKYDFPVGSTVRVLTATGSHDMRVVGISKFGSANSPLGATVAMFDRTTAQALTNNVGKFTAIRAAADRGVSQQQLTVNIDRVLPHGIQAITGDAAVKEQQDAIKNGFLNFFTTFLLVFAIIAMFVGAFVIYNTFSIVVAQRTREMALLRAIGASRRQVLTSVIGEAAVVGTVCSLLGLVAGVGLALLLKAALGAIGFGIPATGAVITAGSMITAFLLGLIVTMVAAIAPALRASRVAPVAAMRSVAVDSSAASVPRLVAGAVVLLGGIGLLFLGLFGNSANALASVGGGAAFTFLGVAILAPVFARPLASAIGAPLARVAGVSGRLARGNASRNPKRTSSTAAALMIGVGLVAFFTIFAASATASVSHAIDQQFHGDFFIDSGQQGDAGLPPTVATQIRGVPGVETVLPVQIGGVEINGDGLNIAGMDTAGLSKLADLGVQQGSYGALGRDQIAVSHDYAKDHDLSIGSRLAVKFPDTGRQVLTVAMIYEHADLVGPAFLARSAFQANVNDHRDTQIYLSASQSQLPGVRDALDRITKPYPTAKVQDVSEIKQQQAAQINTILALVYVLLVLAVFIALLGIMNTLALSIFERTHELGLIRAVGMSRRQLRSTVRWESVIIALLGTVLGLAIGLFFGWAVVHALSSQGINTLSVPVGQLVVVVVVAALAGVLAAVLPAHRASRLNVLDAIISE